MKRKQRTQAGRHCYKCIENFILYTLHTYIGADFLASSYILCWYYYESDARRGGSRTACYLHFRLFESTTASVKERWIFCFDLDVTKTN